MFVGKIISFSQPYVYNFWIYYFKLMFYLFSIFLVLFVIYTHKINQPLLERFPISYLHTILYHSWFTIPSILSFIVSFLGFYNICYSLVSIQPAYCSIYSFCHPIFDNSVIIFFVSYGFSSLLHFVLRYYFHWSFYKPRFVFKQF